MSEKIDQFHARLQQQLKSLEENLCKTGESIKAKSQESADAIRSHIDASKNRIAEIKQDADAKVTALREKIKNNQSDAAADIDGHIKKLKQDCDHQLTHLQKSWDDAVTDITGGTIF